MMGRWYELRMTKDDDGTLLVTSPQFPEVTTFGTGHEDALLRGLDAIIEAMAARIAADEPIPTPLAKPINRSARVELPALIYLKVALYMVARETGVSRAELARKLGVYREQVDRLFRLNHRSRLDLIEKAANALGVRVEIELPRRKAKAA
jgi:antitoxin HicB